MERIRPGHRGPSAHPAALALAGDDDGEDTRAWEEQVVRCHGWLATADRREQGDSVVLLKVL